MTDKLIKVQQELKAPKSQFNKFGKYNYRNCEDILEAAKPLLSKHGLLLTITDELKECILGTYVEAKVTITDGDKSYSVTAQAGIDIDRKGMDISQSYGSSSSYARKYALNGLFLIDDTKDADSTNNHWKTKQFVKPSTPKKPVLNAATPAFEKALKFVREGGSISDIKKKYVLGEGVENLLKL